jgi:hypothetical protein
MSPAFARPNTSRCPSEFFPCACRLAGGFLSLRTTLTFHESRIAFLLGEDDRTAVATNVWSCRPAQGRRWWRERARGVADSRDAHGPPGDSARVVRDCYNPV